MITPAQAKKLRDLIQSRVDAEVADSWKGAQPPEEHALIEAELNYARLSLEFFIKELGKKNGPRK